jgi:hypothetical protein
MSGARPRRIGIGLPGMRETVIIAAAGFLVFTIAAALLVYFLVP